MATDLQLILSTCPSEAAAALARQLVEERLAACCNRIESIQSTYWWEGEVTSDSESLLIFKAPAERVPALMQRLQALHPYDVPEILALDVDAGLEAYLAWARRACMAER